jgi:hypothetical protein
VLIDYQQTRRRYRRKGYHAERGQTEYEAPPASVPATVQRFSQVVELPERAQNVHLYRDAKELPERYRSALQNVR